MTGINRPTIFIVPRDEAAMTGLLCCTVMARFTDRHQVCRIGEQLPVPLVVQLVVDDGSIGREMPADQKASASRPLTAIVIPRQDLLAKGGPCLGIVERTVLGAVPGAGLTSPAAVRFLHHHEPARGDTAHRSRAQPSRAASMQR